MGQSRVHYTFEKNDSKMYHNIAMHSPQYGRGDNLLYYKSNYRRQRGGGLGSILGAIARKLIPFSKQVLWPAAKKYILPHAQTAAIDFAGDVMEGRNIRESFKEHGKKAIKASVEQFKDQSGSGSQRKRKRSQTLKKKKKRQCTLLSSPDVINKL